MMAGQQPRAERRFYVGAGVFLLLLNLLAFSPAILDPSTRRVPLPFTPLVIAHVAVSLLLLLLFIAQGALVAKGRIDFHRQLGIVGAGLVVAMIGLGYAALVGEARRGFDLSGDLSTPPLPPALVVPITMSTVIQLVLFALLFGSAFLYRHRPDIHKRLMLMAFLGVLSQPPVAHLVGHWPAFRPYALLLFPIASAICLAPSAIHDKLTSGRVQPLSIWAPVAVFVTQVIFFVVVAPTPWWGSVSRELIR
ncbi:hypothetical protein ABDK56_08355 [Sphingomonas sp. ASV193]|uniref:hypothetical protein n=1 Tax=Sphingomonas sp. ASV193 TaxID=3144405 RepID=UPI0032E8DA90